MRYVIVVECFNHFGINHNKTVHDQVRYKRTYDSPVIMHWESSLLFDRMTAFL